jgi:mono/diheme cytochrome c family protein
MIRSGIRVLASAVIAVMMGVTGVRLAGAAGTPLAQRAQSSGGWQIPSEALQTKNPLNVDDKVLASGKKVFGDKCKKCHGSAGLGDGPDADPEHAEDMNLTNPKRADRNPDGVVFYKVSNGRKKPKMPAFKDELSTEQIWSVVAYVQTLRTK